MQASQNELETRVDCTPVAQSPIDRIISIATQSDAPFAERRTMVDRIDPSGKLRRAAMDKLKSELKDSERYADAAKVRLDNLLSEQAKSQMLVRSLERYKDWEIEETARFVLEKNEHSRVHKLQEAFDTGLIYDGEARQFSDPRDVAPMLNSRVFVVRHDWAAAFEHSDMEGAEYRLPFELCLFEFRITGRTIIVFAWEQDKIEPHRGHTLWLEGTDGMWFSLAAKAVEEISRFVWKQIRAICIALDAQIAEHQVVRAPCALNEKRAKTGKPPLRDFHIVDLSRRVRAATRSAGMETGRRVRMHFRRGHWRHFESHKTWINWMLVGNPDLGFIDKQYRI